MAQCAEIMLAPKTKLALLIFAAIFMCLSAGLMYAAESQVASAKTANAAAGKLITEQGGAPLATAEEEEHHLSQKAEEVAHVFNLPITNSMVVSWIVAIGLILFARVATRDMKHVPGGAQNLLEWLVEGLYGFLESIIGPHLVKRTFWFFATIFIFILSGKLVRPDSRGRHDRVGTSDLARFRDRSTAVSRGECRSEPDVRHGLVFLRLLDRLGACGKSARSDFSKSCSRPRARRPGL